MSHVLINLFGTSVTQCLPSHDLRKGRSSSDSGGMGCIFVNRSSVGSVNVG